MADGGKPPPPPRPEDFVPEAFCDEGEFMLEPRQPSVGIHVHVKGVLCFKYTVTRFPLVFEELAGVITDSQQESHTDTPTGCRTQSQFPKTPACWLPLMTYGFAFSLRGSVRLRGR